MVEASNRGSGVDKGLTDVQELLTTQLPFNSFQLIDKKEGSIPGNNVLAVKHNYFIQYSGSQANLNLVMRHGSSEVLRTAVQLLANKPLILGGFPSENGKFIFILIAR